MSVESLPGAALAPAVGLEIDTDSVQRPTTQLQVQDPSLNSHTPQNDIQLNTHIDINSCSNTFAAPDTATSLLAVRRGDDGSHDASTTTSEQHHGAVAAAVLPPEQPDDVQLQTAATGGGRKKVLLYT